MFMVTQADKHISLGMKERRSNASVTISAELPAWKLKIFESDTGDELFETQYVKWFNNQHQVIGMLHADNESGGMRMNTLTEGDID